MSPLIADFIDEMSKDEELTSWTVALIGKDSASAEDEAVIAGLKLAMLTRRKSVDHDDRYSIKTLSAPREEAIDRTEGQWKAALERSRETGRGDTERNESKEPPTEPRGPAIRKVLGEGWSKSGVPAVPQRGLLMLYLLAPAASEIPALKAADPIVAFAISFPGSSSERRVSNAAYMANSVMWGALNDWVD